MSESEVILNIQDYPGKENRVNTEDICINCKAIIRKQIHRSTEHIGLEENLSSVLTLLHGCIKSKENTSVLLLGRRGAGKTTIVKQVISNLKARYHSELGYVYLNGLLHAEDEKVALQEILKQLKLEDDLFASSESKATISFTEGIRMVFESLSNIKSSNKVIIFFLDEFDLFATLPKRQTILYTLLDSLHSSEYQMAIVGISSRLDTLELLEKRVRSRFSQRQILFSGLSTPTQLLKIMEIWLSFPPDINRELITENFFYYWNENIKMLCSNIVFNKMIEDYFLASRDIRWFKQACQLALSQISVREPNLTISHFQYAFSQLTNDAKSVLMSGLSILQLCLITAMKRLREQEVFVTNFEQVYKEFNDFASLHLKQMLVEKAVCLKAFEQLLELEIIKPVENTKNHREFQRVKLMLLNQQIVSGLQNYTDCPTNLVKWGTKWIE